MRVCKYYSLKIFMKCICSYYIFKKFDEVLLTLQELFLTSLRFLSVKNRFFMIFFSPLNTLFIIFSCLQKIVSQVFFFLPLYSNFFLLVFTQKRIVLVRNIIFKLRTFSQQFVQSLHLYVLIFVFSINFINCVH